MDRDFEKDVLLCERDWVRSVPGFHTPGHLSSSHNFFSIWQSFSEPCVCHAVLCDGVGMQSPLKSYWSMGHAYFYLSSQIAKKTPQVYF